MALLTVVVVARGNCKTHIIKTTIERVFGHKEHKEAQSFALDLHKTSSYGIIHYCGGQDKCNMSRTKFTKSTKFNFPMEINRNFVNFVDFVRD